MPGLANSYLQIKIIIITVRAVGPAIDVVRRHYGVDHLHEPDRSLDRSSDSGFPHGASVEMLPRLAIFELFPVFESFTASAEPGVLPCKCKGMREYVRKPPPSSLARDTAGARECGAT